MKNVFIRAFEYDYFLFECDFLNADGAVSLCFFYDFLSGQDNFGEFGLSFDDGFKIGF